MKTFVFTVSRLKTGGKRVATFPVVVTEENKEDAWKTVKKLWPAEFYEFIGEKPPSPVKNPKRGAQPVKIACIRGELIAVPSQGGAYWKLYHDGALVTEGTRAQVSQMCKQYQVSTAGEAMRLRKHPAKNPETHVTIKDITAPTKKEIAELVNLWHLSKVYASSRYERMMWASSWFAKEHPGITSTWAYKILERRLAGLHAGNPSGRHL